MWNKKGANGEPRTGDDSARMQPTIIPSYENQVLPDFCTIETKQPNISVQNQIPRVISRSGKRPPTTFIDSRDWSLYLRICCQLHHIKVTYECTELEAEQILQAGRRDYGNRVTRLVCAFNRLYAEYSRLSSRLSKNPNVKRKSVGRFDDVTPQLSPEKKRTEPSKSIQKSMKLGNGTSSADVLQMSNTINQATVSSGCGDTDVLNTDITLEPTSLQSIHLADDSQKSRSDERLHQKLSLTDPATSRPPLVQVDPAEEMTPYESSASARTLMNSTSTSLHFTNRETPTSSCDPSRSSLTSQQPLNRPSNSVCFRWCGRSLRRPDSRAQWNRKREALRLCKRLQRSSPPDFGCRYSGSRSAVEQQSLYDQIIRAAELANVLVYQHGSHCYQVEHVVHWIPRNTPQNWKEQSEIEAANNLLGAKFSTVRLPIALELILPKMQCQIEKVMKHCENICDPLEVAAELRQLNYDTDACITYFHHVRNLREIINEFLPQTYTDSKGAFRDRHFITTPSNSALDNSGIPGLRSRTTFPHPEYTDVLLHLRNLLISLRRLHTDVSKCLSRLRCGTTDLVTKLRTDLEEKVITKVWAVMSTDKTASCDSPRNGKSIAGLVCPSTPGKIGSNTEDASFAQLTKLVQENHSLKLTLRTEENRRRAVFNMMQEYLGNIRIYCRCRGISTISSCIEARPLVDTILLHNNPDGTNSEVYKFDRVFDANATQAEVYTELAPSVCSFLDGYNVCFLTYGGEASGKTYTLLGAESDLIEKQGIAQRALRTVLSEREARMQEWNYHLASAVVEIYNDTLIDLLSSEKGISIRVDSGPDRMLENLKTIEIEQESDIEQLLGLCRERRHTGCTALNNQSSRSHLIIFARLSARSRIHDTFVCSLLALCDLAGFEDIIKAETLMDPVLAKEAGYINRSLTALNRVFMSLRTQDPSNVSYRDTKLTFLLKPFFTQSGKCILIVTVRTDKNTIASTQSTLRFARDSRGVSLGRARRQFNLDKLIDDMRSS
ncbi:Kinesin protein [Fasciola gigantica]|uniref:Kinesin protein n=1 Tax=Fasciola gigantica TaxID=46835 RepID=A0A504Z206_FASGI|nr:Kinesin protein [Fasciola gigantica]